MTADNPSPLMPKLRFPEFGNMPGWGLTQLSCVLDYEQPGKYIVEDTSYQNVGTPVLTANKGFVLGHTAETDGIYQQVPVIIFDDFTTDAKYVDFPFKVKSSAIKILTSRGEDELRLVYELMSRIRFDSTQHKRYFISQYQYLKIPLPGKSEQKKITDCLGSLDDLIAAEGRKLEALRQHKQGLMQQLFPQPGETQPFLRFTEFRDAPKWEQAALGTLLDRPPEYGANAAAVPFSENLPAYIRITDIDDDGRFVPAPRVSVDIEPSDDQFLQAGDIVLARTGASVGKSYRYRVEDGRLVFAGFLIRVRPNLDRLVPEFLSAYLSTWSYWDWVRLTSARSGQPGINRSEYASMPLTMPTDAASLPEQRKIADCFAALDGGIAAQRQRLRALRCHKNGLLQQLFPNPRAT